jgi:hypothetical protein
VFAEDLWEVTFSAKAFFNREDWGIEVDNKAVEFVG